MCAIVGVINSEGAAKTAYYGLFAMQHRGQEASGISSSFNHHIKTIKATGLVTEVFSPASFELLKGNIAIGHNRYGTAGADSLKDAQPVAGNYALGEISIVHNGNLINKDEIRRKLVSEGAIFQSGMDTENILHLIARSKQEHLKDRIVEALNQCVGAYRYGVRPLSIGRLKDVGYIVASETCAFDLVGAEFIRDVKPGEMVIFEEGKDEFSSVQILKAAEARICAFEYIYFARPDSVVEGKNVYEVRKKLGAALARKCKELKADFVVPVPDSGVPAALGFAQESKLPFEMAIVRNHYIGRTFIEPTQEVRNLKVKLKLNPIGAALHGKSVAVIDDSIVRGTTSKKIVELLRHAGAAHVHMCIASPELKYPERYGIDTPSVRELIAANMSTDEICKFIGADSLTFLSVPELVEALGGERKYSLVSFDGDYFIKD